MREYVNSFEDVACTAAQDLCVCYLNNNGYAAATRINVMCTDVALPSAQQVQLRCKVLQSATIGSGGTTNAAIPLDDGDSSAGSSCHQNDTAQATGTTKVVWEGGCYLYQGLDVIFNQPIPFNSVGTTTAFVFEMQSVPSGTINLSGAVYFTEQGLVGS